jgi:hypothetical protein
MKKIMFNDRYGLTGAVLRGDKTMTRRMMTMTLHRRNKYGQMVKIVPDDMFIASDGTAHFQVGRNGYMVPKQNQPAYHVGEEIAIAQSYHMLNKSGFVAPEGLDHTCESSAGYENKMFVRADLMPHRIIIRKVDVQRLQRISDEDCMKEGIMEGEFMNTWDTFYFDEWGDVPNHITFKRPRDAYRNLIDRISGKGTWQRNPWVYVYTFKLLPNLKTKEL